IFVVHRAFLVLQALIGEVPAKATEYSATERADASTDDRNHRANGCARQRTSKRTRGSARAGAYVIRVRRGCALILETARDRVQRVAQEPKLIRSPITLLEEVSILLIQLCLIQCLLLRADARKR